ncbi:hypothetical protein CMV_001329, partial [Castanea mollissima]
ATTQCFREKKERGRLRSFFVVLLFRLQPTIPSQNYGSALTTEEQVWSLKTELT